MLRLFATLRVLLPLLVVLLVVTKVSCVAAAADESFTSTTTASVVTRHVNNNLNWNDPASTLFFGGLTVRGGGEGGGGKDGVPQTSNNARRPSDYEPVLLEKFMRWGLLRPKTTAPQQQQSSRSSRSKSSWNKNSTRKRSSSSSSSVSTPSGAIPTTTATNTDRTGGTTSRVTCACGMYIWDAPSALLYKWYKQLCKDCIIEGMGGAKFVRINSGSMLQLLHPMAKHITSTDRCAICHGCYRDHLQLRWCKTNNVYSPFDLMMDAIQSNAVVATDTTVPTKKKTKKGNVRNSNTDIQQQQKQKKKKRKFAFHNRYVTDVSHFFDADENTISAQIRSMDSDRSMDAQTKETLGKKLRTQQSNEIVKYITVSRKNGVDKDRSKLEIDRKNVMLRNLRTAKTKKPIVYAVVVSGSAAKDDDVVRSSSRRSSRRKSISSVLVLRLVQTMCFNAVDELIELQT